MTMFASSRSSSREADKAGRSGFNSSGVWIRLNFDRSERTIGAQWNRANHLLALGKNGQPIGSRDLLFCDCLGLFMRSHSS